MPKQVRWLAIAAVVIGYAILANYTNQSAHNGTLGALLALAPIVLTSLVLAWRSAQRTAMLGLITLAGSALWLSWPLLTRHYGWIYWLEHESVQWVLFLTFARTLIANRQPLCSQFAETLHGPLTPAHARYAEKVTIAWAAFFAVMIITSSWLFFMYPIGIWSIFSNFVFLPLVILMFIVEFIIRQWALPDIAHANIMDAVRTYMDNARHKH